MFACVNPNSTASPKLTNPTNVHLVRSGAASNGDDIWKITWDPPGTPGSTIHIYRGMISKTSVSEPAFTAALGSEQTGVTDQISGNVGQVCYKVTAFADWYTESTGVNVCSG